MFLLQFAKNLITNDVMIEALIIQISLFFYWSFWLHRKNIIGWITGRSSESQRPFPGNSTQISFTWPLRGAWPLYFCHHTHWLYLGWCHASSNPASLAPLLTQGHNSTCITYLHSTCSILWVISSYLLPCIPTWELVIFGLNIGVQMIKYPQRKM